MGHSIWILLYVIGKDLIVGHGIMILYVIRNGLMVVHGNGFCCMLWIMHCGRS